MRSRSARNPRGQPSGLRAFIWASTLALALLAAVSGAAMIFGAVQYRRQVSLLAEDMADLRAVEELQVGILLHERAAVMLARGSAEARARSKVAEARALRSWQRTARHRIRDADEMRMLATIERKLQAYWDSHDHDFVQRQKAPEDSRRADRRLREVLTAIDAFAQHHYQQAEITAAHARRLGTWMFWSSIVMSLALVAVVSLTLVAAGRKLHLPLLRIREAIRRAGSGAADVTVPEVGVREIREIACSFNELNASLAEQTRIRRAFLGAVGHDLRNPIAALKWIAACYRPGRPLPNERRTREAFATMEKLIAEVDHIAADLLDTARLEAGELRLDLEPQELGPLLEELVAAYRPLAGDHEVVLELPREPVTVRCDAVRLRQAAGNLVSNALKYASGGRVEVRLAGEGEEAVISVADSGPGIPLEKQRYLFEPFRRLGTAAKGVPGTGLGLFIAKRIVDGHGGRIDVESAPGEGATFHIRLARTADLPARAAPAEEGRESRNAQA